MNRWQRVAVVIRDWSHVAWRMPLAVVDRTPLDAFRQGHLAPVVLLPGIWEPWRFLVPLARALNEMGHPVHPVPGLGWNGRSLKESAAIVSDALAGQVPSPAVLVAHSKGGLIGKRVMLDEVRPGERAVGLVAVGSPFGGVLTVLAHPRQDAPGHVCARRTGDPGLGGRAGPELQDRVDRFGLGRDGAQRHAPGRCDQCHGRGRRTLPAARRAARRAARARARAGLVGVASLTAVRGHWVLDGLAS